MQRIAASYLLVTLAFMMVGEAVAQRQRRGTIGWRQAQSQPDEWFQTDEAARIADNLLVYQHPSGGWGKNIEMARPLTDEQKAEIRAGIDDVETIIDNKATHSQIQYLARAYKATGEERYRESLLRGIEYLLQAQYENGGWPMIYPLRRGYYSHITFNDGAMIGVMRVLRDFANSEAPFDFEGVDPAVRERAGQAIAKGLKIVLATQVTVDGQRTAWCAQHDAQTLEPQQARSYELPSLSGQESVGIVRYLMELEDPSPEVIQAVHSAVRWFDEAKIEGLRVRTIRDPSLPRGRDRVTVEDPDAPALWARFYEIGTNRPMFVGRDGVVKDSLNDIEHERRVGYSYVGNYGEALLEKYYPRWLKRMGDRTESAL